MRYLLICGSVLGVLVIGCNQKEEAPATTPDAASKVETPAAPAADVEAPSAPAPMTDAPPAPVSPSAAEVAKPAEPPTAAPTTNPSTAEAQSKLELVTQYIKDKKYDLAEKLLTELEANKSSLPVSLQGQISTARTALKTAKAASGASDAVGGIKAPSF